MSSEKTVGRPTVYKPELGVKILELMEQGLSLFAACGELNINRSTVYLWLDAHSDFASLIELGKQKRLVFLERRLMNDAATGPQTTANIFALKNASPDWREDTKQQIELSGPGGAPLIQTIAFKVIDSKVDNPLTIEGEVMEDE